MNIVISGAYSDVLDKRKTLMPYVEFFPKIFVPIGEDLNTSGLLKIDLCAFHKLLPGKNVIQLAVIISLKVFSPLLLQSK